MPSVPRYDSPQVEQRALPGTRQSSVASPSLFNAAADQQVAMGKGLMQAGEQVNAIAVKMQERENADLLFRTETALKDEYLKHEAGVRERKGQNAWGVTTETEQWFAEQEKKHSDALGNDVQRNLFKQQVTRLRQSAMGSISQYESGERRRSIEESAQASIVGSINMAAARAAEGLVSSGANPGGATITQDENGNPVATAPGVTVGDNPIAGIKSDILKRVQVIAQLNGWAPERRALEEEKHLTNLHKQVIQAIVDKNPAQAREYFEANKAEIAGSEHDGIGKFLKTGALKTVAQEAADAVTALGMSEAEAVDHIRKNYSGDEEAAAVAEVKTRFAEVQGARERMQRDASDTAWGIYARTGRVNSIPASVLASLDGRDLAALKDHARIRAERAAGGGTVKTDFGTYYDLRQMAVSDPEGFAKVDLRRYTGKLSGSDLEEFAKLQTGKPQEVKDAATLSQQLSTTYNTLGWGSSKREQKGAFDRAVTDAINAEQKLRGKSLNYDERQAIIDRMAIEGDVNGMWPGGGRRYYEVQGKPEAAKFAPEIPAAEKQQIVDRFTKRKGRAPSKDELNQIYRQWKGL